MFERVPAAEMDGGSKLSSIYAPYPSMVKVLGEPHKNGDADYPDDPYKTDVCWSVRSIDNPAHIVTIWNYKNGPAYNDGEGTIEEIDYFSAYYTDRAFFDRILALIAPPAS